MDRSLSCFFLLLTMLCLTAMCLTAQTADDRVVLALYDAVSDYTARQVVLVR